MEEDFKTDCYYLALDAGEDTEYAIEFNQKVDTFRTFSYYEGEIWDASSSFNIDKPTGDDSFKNLLLRIKPYLTLGNPASIHELELNDKELVEELIDFFNCNLNYEPYVLDPYIRSEDLNGSYSINYSHNLEDYNLESILQMIFIYLHITNARLEISEDQDISIDDWSDYYKFGVLNLDEMTKICDLVCSVVSIEGFEYEYNDGAYNRQSGYSKDGFYFHHDIDSNNLKQEVKEYLEYIIPKSHIEATKQQIANLKGYNHKPVFLVEQTRKLIYWLRIVKPLGVNNLKKLEKYVN